MMIMGVVIFIVGLYLVINHKNEGSFCCQKKEDNALGILRERYARGELSSEEFNTMKNALTEK